MTQANRTLVTLLALLAVGGGVGLYAYYGVFQPDKKETEKKEADERLFLPTRLGERKPDGGILETEFVKLTVIAKGDTTVLEHTQGEPWRITSPVNAVADRMAVDALLSQLQQSKFKNVIDENPKPEEVKKYGLDNPDFTVEAVAEVGPNKEKRTVKLEAGVENTYDGSIYMRKNGEPKVYSAEGGVKWTMGKSTFELRDKELLNFDDKTLRTVEVKAKNNEYLLVTDEKRNWKVTARRWAGMKAGAAEGNFDGDPVGINGVITGVKGEKASKFPPDSPAARAAFESPAVDVTFGFEGAPSIRMRLAANDADAGVPYRVLIERDGQATLAEIAGTHVPQLDRLPTDFRDKRLMPFKKEEVAKIRFYTPTGEEIVAEKASPDAGADSWRITVPKQGPAKSVKLASLLWTFGALKQTKVVEESPKDPHKYSLDPRIRSVSIYDAAGKPLGHFEWGKEVPDAPGTAYFRGTRGDVVEAENARLGEFPKSVDDLLDLPPDAGFVFTPDAGAGK